MSLLRFSEVGKGMRRLMRFIQSLERRFMNVEISLKPPPIRIILEICLYFYYRHIYAVSVESSELDLIDFGRQDRGKRLFKSIFFHTFEIKCTLMCSARDMCGTKNVSTTAFACNHGMNG